MSADWKTGDKALCIAGFEGNWRLIELRTPRVGVVYLVTCVVPPTEEDDFLSLKLSGCDHWNWVKMRPGEGYDAACFRKIVPACDRTSIEAHAKE